MAVEITDYELSPKSRKVCLLFMLSFAVVLALQIIGFDVSDNIRDVSALLAVPAALLVNATRLSIWVKK